MKYLITTEIVDKNNNLIEKKNITEESDNFLNVKQLKELGGKLDYPNIDTDDFMHHGKDQQDNELVKLPFIYYKIKLK